MKNTLFLALFLWATLTNAQQVSFPVDDVELAQKPLKTYSAKRVFEANFGKLLYMPEHKGNHYVRLPKSHTFLRTLEVAYAEHRPIILTPDVVWLLIMQGVSCHINENFDVLESKIFKQKGVDTLRIFQDQIFEVYDWHSYIDSLAKLTKAHTKADYYSLFVPEFSTTGLAERGAYQITMLKAFEKKFEYLSEGGCGFPEVTLRGTRQDWLDILQRLDKLDGIGLDFWAAELRPILKEFVAAYEGKVNRIFWRNLFKDYEEYNEHYISGWVIKFFPYIEVMSRDFSPDPSLPPHATGKASFKYILNPYLAGNAHKLSKLDISKFPDDDCAISLTYRDIRTGEEKRLKALAGFVCAAQEDGNRLLPIVSWALKEIVPGESNEPYVRGYRVEEKGLPQWSPVIPKVLAEGAIYAPQQHKTQKESLVYIKNTVVDKVAAKFPKTNLTGVNVRIFVFSDGTMGRVDIYGKSLPSRVKKYIYTHIKALPEHWKPAKTSYRYASLIGGDFSEEESKLPINTHSYVRIRF